VRNAFVETLSELAERDPRVALLTGDLGFTVIEDFAKRYPDRFWNVGVAEQNMVGLATGLAEAGFLPFVYSIASFATMRPYEFIRNGPVAQELPVRIVGVGGGFDYGHNGISHYALEDIGLMRLQPGTMVVAPADAAQARAALLATWDTPASIYYRVGKESAVVPGLDGHWEPGRAQLIGEGSDVALIALGSMAHEAVRAAELLAAEGIECTVAVVACFNPSPLEDLADLVAGCRLAITAEAHYVSGGLGSLVCELVAERGLPCTVLRRGVEKVPSGATGSRSYLYELHGLSAARLAGAAVEALALAERS
jgi:transketolase